MSAAADGIEAEVVGLGAQGDGIVETPAGRFHVPFTAPGDRLRLAVEDGAVTAVERVADGGGRRAPVCTHFGTCGGCVAQHVRDDDYAAWKRNLVVQALTRRDLDVAVAAPVGMPPGARRRVRLGARAVRGGVILGFKQRRSHRLVEVRECPVAAAAIVAALPGLRAALADCLPRGSTAEVAITLAATGLDVAVEDVVETDLALSQRLAAFAAETDLARLAWAGEAVAQRRPVRIDCGGIAVDLPPGAFLQPTEAGEAALRDRVLSALGNATRIVDLHAGCGAFGLPLAAAGGLPLAAAGKTVRAYEIDPAQVDAVTAAARRAGLGIAAETRDLERRPLAGPELDGLDGVVMDPPRAGAPAQSAALAASPVPVIAYVSCNPATFARDARVLVDGGYTLGDVTPVDQFLWSHHVELVGVFRR